MNNNVEVNPNNNVEISQNNELNQPKFPENMSHDNLNRVNKSRKNIFPLVLVSLIFLLLCGITWYYINNPKIILAKTVNKHFNTASILVNKNPLLNSVFKNNNLGMNSGVDITLEDSMNYTKDFKNINLLLEYIEDKDKEKGYASVKATINNEDTVELITLLENQKAYFTIKDILEKYYFTDYQFISYLNENLATPENINYLVEILKNNLGEVIREKELQSENTTLTINNKEIKVKKITLDVTEKLMSEIVQRSLLQIKNDEKALVILESIFDLKRAEVINKIDEMITSINDNDIDDEEVIFTYAIYSKLFAGVIKEEINTESFVIDYFNYEDIKNIIITSEKEEVLNLKFKKEKNNSSVEGTISTLNINGKYNHSTFDFSFVSKDPEALVNIEVTGDYSKKELTNNKIENVFNIIIKADLLDTLDFKVDIKSKTNIEANVNIPTLDISNNKKLEDLTLEEITEVYNKAEDNSFFKLLFNNYVYPMQTPNYNYNYDYDYNYNYDYDYDYNDDIEYNFDYDNSLFE